MRNRGPSPVVPFLLVGVLGSVVFGPTVLSMMEFFSSLFETGDSESTLVIVLILLLMLVGIHFLSTFFPTLACRPHGCFHQTTSSGFDTEGCGLGSLLLVLLFLVLYYNWMWCVLKWYSKLSVPSFITILYLLLWNDCCTESFVNVDNNNRWKICLCICPRQVMWLGFYLVVFWWVKFIFTYFGLHMLF